jgi:hypothetical protein
LLPYWNLVQKSDNFPKRSYENVATRTPEKHFIVTVQKNITAMANFRLKKKPLTKSFVMKIGCKIRVSRFKPLEQAIAGPPCSKGLYLT